MSRLPQGHVMLILTMLLGCVSCSEVEKAPEVRSEEVRSLDEAEQFQSTLRLGQIYPLADGSAYLASYVGPVFHISGRVAQRVEGLPEESRMYDLVPLADGSALLSNRFGNPPELYSLRGTQATPVALGDSIAKSPPSVSTEGFLFAENQRLRAELDEVTSRLDDMQHDE